MYTVDEATELALRSTAIGAGYQWALDMGDTGIAPCPYCEAPFMAILRAGVNVHSEPSCVQFRSMGARVYLILAHTAWTTDR